MLELSSFLAHAVYCCQLRTTLLLSKAFLVHSKDNLFLVEIAEAAQNPDVLMASHDAGNEPENEVELEHFDKLTMIVNSSVYFLDGTVASSIHCLSRQN